MLTAKQAAELLGVNDSRVRQLARSGQLKAVKQGRDWMIDENDVEAFKRPARGPKGPRTKE